jgi:hypothetical protein
MSFATQRDSFSRTPQDLVIIGVRECQNHYAATVDQGLQYTEDFTNAVWTKNNLTVTANNTTAPDGTLTADKLTPSLAGGTAEQDWDTGAAVANKKFTLIFFAKVAVNHTLRIAIRDGAGSDGATADFVMTTTQGVDGWLRCEVTIAFTGAASGNVVRAKIAPDPTTTEYAWVWGTNLYRSPGDSATTLPFPYVKRTAEAIGLVATKLSRCLAADAGDGKRCWYARPACQDPDHFNKGNTWEQTASLRGFREFRFCRHDAPLAIYGDNVAPYLDDFDSRSQEIITDKGLTDSGRISFAFFDDAGPGVWNVVQQQRGALVNTIVGSGTFWRRWYAIYRNYSNPAGYLIRKAGFVEPGVTESSYEQRGRYVMRNVKFTQDDRMVIECNERLKLGRKEIPAKISQSNVLATSIDDTTTTVKLGDVGEISTPAPNATAASPDYKVVLEIDFDVPANSEKVNVTSRDLTLNTAVIQRARWGTTGKYHAAGAKVREVAEFGTERSDPTGIPLAKNPVDIVVELYRYAGIDLVDIDTVTLYAERDTWLTSVVDPVTSKESGVLFRRTLTEKKKVEELIKEIRELLMLLLWVSEDQRITGKVFAPPVPSQTVVTLSDDNGLVDSSVEIDDTDESRLTRALVAWDLAAGESGDKPEDFDLIQIYIALDEEEADFYGEERAKVILSQWLRAQDLKEPSGIVSRIVSRFRRGARTFRHKLEIKDDSVKLGQTVEIDTNKLQKPDGSNDPRFVIVTKKKVAPDGTIQIEAMEMPLARVWFYAPNELPDYDSASTSDKRYGYLTDTQGLVGSTKEPGHVAW